MTELVSIKPKKKRRKVRSDKKRVRYKGGKGRQPEPWAPYGCGSGGWVPTELKDRHIALSGPADGHTYYHRRVAQYRTAVASVLLKAIDECRCRPMKTEMAGFLNANGISTFTSKPWTRQNIHALLTIEGALQYVADSKETYELREAAALAGLLNSPES